MSFCRSVVFLLFLLSVEGRAQNPVKITRVDGNVYVVEDNAYYKENSAFYVGEEYVTVVGATWTPETARHLALAIRKITSKPIREVINTNYHPDRAGGNAYFRNIGASIISTEQTKALIGSDWESIVNDTRKSMPDYPPVPKVLPDKVFDGDFELQNGKIQALYRGPSHTVDGIVVYFPDEKILYGGCMIKERLGNLEYAGLREYPHTLRKIKSLDIKTIIAGHWNPIHGPDLIDKYIILLDDLIRENKTMFRYESAATEIQAVSQGWMDAIQERHDQKTLSEIRRRKMVFSDGETRWSELIRSRMPAWSNWVDSLSVAFGNIRAPRTVVVIAGNAGGADAFTWGDTTIGFNLHELESNYGSALDEVNTDRIDRLFAHELTHILHKAWTKKHPVSINSPYEGASWECYAEGIGNYRSLTSRWRNEKGELTGHARTVLDRLEPVFVERMIKLQKASPEEAIKLTTDLSNGPFDRKWGALTVALWLAEECRGDDRNLRKWVEAGPQGVLVLARKHLSPHLSADLFDSKPVK